MRRIKLPKSVMFSWALSYVIILIIPVMVFFYGTMVSSRLVRSEVSRSNTLILDNISRTMDNQMLALNNAFFFAFSNNSFTRLANSSQMDSAFYSKAETLQRALNEYYMANENISILVYFHRWDYVVSHNTANTVAPLYLMQRMAGLDMAEEDWRALLAGDYKGFMFSGALRLGASERHLVYAHTVHMSGSAATIFTMVPYARVAENAQLLSDSTLLLADDAGEVLAAFGAQGAFTTLNRAWAHEESVTGEDGRRYVLTLRGSAQSSWQYALATPEEDYWMAFSHINTLFILSIAVSLLLGLLTAWFLLRRNYRPLQSITRMLGHRGAGGNEYDLIAATYNRLSSENTSIRGQLDAQSAQLRERYVLSQLKGRRHTLASADTNAYYQIETTGKTYCLVAFTIEPPAAEEPGPPEKHLEADEVLLFALNNVFTETIERYPFYKMEDGRELLYLLYLDEAELAAWDEEKEKLTEFVCGFFQSHLSVTVACAISAYTAGFEQVSALYTDTMRALEYKAITGYPGVMMAEDYRQMTGGTAALQNTQWFGDLADAVTRGDFERCREVTANLFARREEDMTSLLVFRIEIIECMHTVLNAYSGIVTNNEQRQGLVLKIIDLMPCDTAGDLQGKFLDALQYACDTAGRALQGASDTLVQKVRQYIDENYADCNLNIGLISDQFAKNPNYLSQVYFRQTGQGLLDTIHEVQIRHAKDLLRDPANTIEQVALAVGFSNPRTFRRVFVKLSGIKPSQYQAR